MWFVSNTQASVVLNSDRLTTPSPEENKTSKIDYINANHYRIRSREHELQY